VFRADFLRSDNFFADSNINELDQGCHSLLYSNHCLLFTLQVYAKIPDTFSAEKIMPVSHNTEFEVEFEIFSLLLDFFGIKCAKDSKAKRLEY